MELPTGFVEARANGFYIITRPVYYDMAVSVAEQDPETILARATSVSSNGGSGDEPGDPRPMTGRGTHVELPGEGNDKLVLKKNRRGGLYAKLRGDVHRNDYAALNEVFLSETAWKKGVPVALVGFVMSAKAGEGRLASFRRGYTATIKVEGARNLSESLIEVSGSERRAILRAAAQGVDRAHGRGFLHGDLNLGNILIVPSEHHDFSAWLIDLSHSHLGGSLPFKRRLQNLMRLYRSAEKWLPATTPAQRRRRTRDIVEFLRAYTGGNRAEMRRYVQGAARYRASLFMHRLGWKMQTGSARADR